VKALEINHTRVRVHPLALIGAIVFIGAGQGGAVLAALLALVIHELAHVFTAKAFHLPVPEIEFTPFGGVAHMEDISEATPVQQFVVAAAGPLMSWICCLVCAGLLQMNWVSLAQIEGFLRWNLLLLCFNLIPVLPLDGGRMLQALLTPWLGWQKAMRILSNAGILAGLLLNGLAIWGAIHGVANISLVITGCYLMYAAHLSRTMAAVQCIHGVISKKMKLEREKTLKVEWLGSSGATSIRELFRRMSPGKYHRVIVLDEDGLKSMGELDDSVLVNALLDTPNDTLSEIIKKHK
jgi:stage IV sporulation protein FB